MKHIFLLLSILFSFNQTSNAQQGSSIIKGSITSSQKPVGFVSFGLVGTANGGTADENGNYILKDVVPGTYKISFSALGYDKLSKTIMVKDKETLVLAIELKEKQNHLGEVVVTGTMKETYTTLSPIKVEVFTPTLFKKNPTASIFESLQLVNGVQPQLNCNVCSTGDIHINGMEGPYTMVTTVCLL